MELQPANLRQDCFSSPTRIMDSGVNRDNNDSKDVVDCILHHIEHGAP
jgi:hypothetical protein